MPIFLECREFGDVFLSRFWNDQLFTPTAFGRECLVIAVLAIDVLLLIRYERDAFVGQVEITFEATEAIRMEESV